MMFELYTGYTLFQVLLDGPSGYTQYAYALEFTEYQQIKTVS